MNIKRIIPLSIIALVVLLLITSPVWQTWWFNGALIVVLGALVAGGFRFRFNSIREQNV